MNTMQDLIDLIKPILPNALIIDTDEGVLIETGLELDLGGLLQPIERGRVMNQTLCGECLIPVSECAHKLYILDELERDAKLLIQLTNEREEMK